jgi:hypothetical protein
MWADDQGRAGLLFSHLSAASRKHLKNWLEKHDLHRKPCVSTTLPVQKPEPIVLE